jgi:hypothetical protein
MLSASQWAVELAREQGLLVAAEVLSVLDRLPLLLEALHGLGVGEPREGGAHRGERLGVALQHR